MTQTKAEKGVAQSTVREAEGFVSGIISRGPREFRLAFIPESEADRLGQIHGAVGSSKTWGQFYDRMPAKDLREVLERLEEDDAVPDKSEKFDCAILPGFCDGD